MAFAPLTRLVKNKAGKNRYGKAGLRFPALLACLLLLSGPPALLTGCGAGFGKTGIVRYSIITEDGQQDARNMTAEVFGTGQSGQTVELAAGQTAFPPEATEGDVNADSGEETAAPVPEKPLVGLVLKSFENPRHRAMASEARKFMRRNEVYELSATHAPHDTATHSQAAAVDDLVAQNAVVIALAPINTEDSLVLALAVKRALDAGIPVVTFDEPLNRAAATAAALPEDLLFVGPDNTAGANRAAEFLALSLGVNARTVILEDQSPLVTERENALRRLGYLEVIQKRQLKLVENKATGENAETAGEAVLELLKANRDLQALLATGPTAAYGAVLAVEEAKRDGRVWVIAYGTSPDNLELIKEGRLLAALEDHPETWGVEALKTALALRELPELQRGWVVTPSDLLTLESLKESPDEAAAAPSNRPGGVKEASEAP